MQDSTPKSQRMFYTASKPCPHPCTEPRSLDHSPKNIGVTSCDVSCQHWRRITKTIWHGNIHIQRPLSDVPFLQLGLMIIRLYQARQGSQTLERLKYDMSVYLILPLFTYISLYPPTGTHDKFWGVYSIPTSFIVSISLSFRHIITSLVFHSLIAIRWRKFQVRQAGR